MSMRFTRPKLVDDPREDSVRRLRAERLYEVSERVREESMKVNAEFAASERDPDA